MAPFTDDGKSRLDDILEATEALKPLKSPGVREDLASSAVQIRDSEYEATVTIKPGEVSYYSEQNNFAFSPKSQLSAETIPALSTLIANNTFSLLGRISQTDIRAEFDKLILVASLNAAVSKRLPVAGEVVYALKDILEANFGKSRSKDWPAPQLTVKLDFPTQAERLQGLMRFADSVTDLSRKSSSEVERAVGKVTAESEQEVGEQVMAAILGGSSATDTSKSEDTSEQVALEDVISASEPSHSASLVLKVVDQGYTHLNAEIHIETNGKKLTFHVDNKPVNSLPALFEKLESLSAIDSRNPRSENRWNFGVWSKLVPK